MKKMTTEIKKVKRVSRWTELWTTDPSLPECEMSFKWGNMEDLINDSDLQDRVDNYGLVGLYIEWEKIGLNWELKRLMSGLKQELD